MRIAECTEGSVSVRGAPWRAGAPWQRGLRWRHGRRSRSDGGQLRTRGRARPGARGPLAAGPALYPGAGEPTDHEAFALPEEAHSIAEALLPGPLPSAALREIISDRRRYDRAIAALQRHLLVTSAGVHEYGTGWPATVIDLTCRLFDVGRQLDYSYAAGCFLDTMVDATPGELARAYGWPAATARTQLDALR
jgi:hypothetical protein